MFLIAKLGLFALSVAFFMMNRPSAGGFFLGLGIIGMGMASSMRPPRSQRPQARLETFLTEAERPRRHPFFFPRKRNGRRRREATIPIWTSSGSQTVS